MNHRANVKIGAAYSLPEHMRAWVLGDPGQLSLVDKPRTTGHSRHGDDV